MADTNENEAIELANVLKQKQDETSKALDQVKGLGEELRGKMEKSDKVTDELKTDIDKLLTDITGLKSQIQELEQSQVRNPVAEQKNMTLGEMVTKSGLLKSAEALSAEDNIKIKIDTKAIGVGTNLGYSAGALAQPHITPVVTLPNQRLLVRDLLSPGHTGSPAITVPREILFENAAETVDEGHRKPESNLNYDSEVVPVVTIAHYIKASNQVLSDVPALQSMINERLAYGLRLVEEQKLLNGTGQLKGLIQSATPFQNVTTITSCNAIDQLRLAMLQVVLSGYSATGHVLDPIQWTEIEMSKDAIGRYVIGNPQGQITPSLWGLPVVVTPSMKKGQFLVGAFKMGAQIFDRWDMAVAIAFNNEDDFVNNMVTIRCEERLALAIYSPKAFVTGTAQPTLPPTLPPQSDKTN